MAIYHFHKFGPRFGGDPADLHIHNDCNNNSESYCLLGRTYKLPNGMQYNTDESKSYLPGSYYFKVIEYEVFKVIKI